MLFFLLKCLIFSCLANLFWIGRSLMQQISLTHTRWSIRTNHTEENRLRSQRIRNCVICFFERYSTIAMASGKVSYVIFWIINMHILFQEKNPNLLLITQIIHHCQTIHQNAGTKCNLCNARFLKDSDLEFHRRYYHQQQ